jgi:hypothetical protein
MNAVSREVGVALTDADLRIVAWDDWLVRATGLSAEAVRGRTLVEVVPDLETRGVVDLLRGVLVTGTVALLAPAVHEALIPCRPRHASPYFERMQQRVTVGPLRNGDRIEGLMILIEDVTARRERERAIGADLRHPDPAVREWAAKALADATSLVETDALRTSWTEADWQTRRATVWRLAGRADRDLVASLLMALRDGHQDFSVLSSALSLLAFTDVDVVGPLVEFLRDPDAALRIQAALALGDRPDPRATAALLTAVDDTDSNVRFHAIEALGRLRAPAAVDALAAVAESGDFFLAFVAIDALARIGDQRVAPRLLPLLTDEMLRAAVTDALGELASEAVVPGSRGAARPGTMRRSTPSCAPCGRCTRAAGRAAAPPPCPTRSAGRSRPPARSGCSRPSRTPAWTPRHWPRCWAGSRRPPPGAPSRGCSAAPGHGRPSSKRS